jgi:receptor expression-enhancing protein 5/6
MTIADKIKNDLLAYEHDWQLDQYNILNIAHEKTKQPRIFCLIGIITIAILLLIQIFGLSFVSNLFAFVPIYESYKALRSPEGSDDEYWLTYWVVYGSLSLFESFIDGFFFWLPFYFIFKIVFLIWTYHPSSRGAHVIYKSVLEPIFVGVEKEVSEIEKDANEIRAHKLSGRGRGDSGAIAAQVAAASQFASQVAHEQ